MRYPLERWILQLRHSSFLLQTRLPTKTTQHNSLPHSTNAMKKPLATAYKVLPKPHTRQFLTALCNTKTIQYNTKSYCSIPSLHTIPGKFSFIVTGVVETAQLISRVKDWRRNDLPSRRCQRVVEVPSRKNAPPKPTLPQYPMEPNGWYHTSLPISLPPPFHHYHHHN